MSQSIRSRFLALAVLAFTSAATPVQAQETTVDLAPAQTEVSWTVGSALHLVHGTFKLKSGQLRFDTGSGKASGQIVVDVPSGESGSEARDKRMHKEVLESAKYPEAVFVADKVSGQLAPTGQSKLEFHGTFKIHGADHEMTLPATIDRNGNELKANIECPIPYVKWGMKDPSVVFLKVEKVVNMHIKTTVRLP